jgi:hypothetical protein
LSRRLRERFACKVNRWGPQSPFVLGRCWEWTASCGSHGYGQIRDEEGTNRLAHVIAFEWEFGPVPKGMTVDHLCEFLKCVNPTHMEAVTRGENVLRGHSLPALNARKTHCKRGHRLAGANVLLVKRPGKTPGRQCRTCRSAYMKEYRAARVA